MIFLTFLIIPTIIATFAFLVFRKQITLKEFAIQMGVQVFLAGLLAIVTCMANTYDVEVWNGVVASKTKDRVSCSHSYPCNPHPCMCDDKGNCSTCWDTCYDHSYDIDWNVRSSNGESVTIDRVDRQGLNEPPRWTRTQLGEPTSFQHSFTNYIKAAPGTLFRKQGLIEKYKGQFPAYPGNIYDYYRLDRAVALNFSLPDARKWNDDLMALNGVLGRRKQANLILVAVQDKPQEYFQALEQFWLGGKKNDVILVVGVDKELKIEWAEVMAWTDHNILKVKLRDAILDAGVLDREKILPLFGGYVDVHFIRKHMADFKYLKSTITPTVGEWVFGLIVGFLASVGLAVFFYREDIDRGY